ncbi:MAG: hypothetical protein Q7K26_01775 [bacterium]|nr:hypothetical protein [bacterium]
MNDIPELTFSDSIYLIQAAFIRSGALLDLDQIIDEKDGLKRVMMVAVTLSKNGGTDSVISNVIKKTNLLGILKKEAMARSHKAVEKK